MEKLTIRLVRRTAKDLIDAATPFKMDGWARSASRKIDNPEESLFAIECKREGIIGQAGFRVWPPGRSMATSTIAVFDPKYRSRGIGTLVMRMLLAYAFLSLGLARICLGVDENNSAALRCYQKAGFVVVKVRKDGRMLMEVQRESWLMAYDADAQKLADSIGSWVDVV